MWLRFDLDGTTLQLRIRHYRQPARDRYGDAWCDLDLALSIPERLDFCLDSAPDVLMSHEVPIILAVADDLLTGRCGSPEEIEFVNPGFTLYLHPRPGMAGAPEQDYADAARGIEDVSLELRICFGRRGISGNFLSLRLYRADLTALRDYLRLVVGKLSEDSAEIQAMISEGRYY